MVSAIFNWNWTGCDCKTAVPGGMPTSLTFTFAIRTNLNWGLLETVQSATATPTTPLFPPAAATLVIACWLLVLLLSTKTTLPWCWCCCWYFGVALFRTNTLSLIFYTISGLTKRPSMVVIVMMMKKRASQCYYKFQRAYRCFIGTSRSTL